MESQKATFTLSSFRKISTEEKAIKAKKKLFEVLPKAPKRFGQNTSTFFAKTKAFATATNFHNSLPKKDKNHKKSEGMKGDF